MLLSEFRFFRSGLLLILLFFQFQTGWGMVHVTVRDEKTGEPQKHTGRMLVDYRTSDPQSPCSLEDRMGRIYIFKNTQILEITEDDTPFTPCTNEEAIKNLQEEYGDSFEVHTTEHFLFLYNTSTGYAQWCGELLEKLYLAFERFAEQKNLKLTDNGYPMIVLLFSNIQEFRQYASQDLPDSKGILAYYNMQSNRTFLYELSGLETETADQRRAKTYKQVAEILSRPQAALNVATIIHEATHQLAFNRGLFQRTGPIELWVVEGLSLVFETPDETSTRGWTYRGSTKVNKRQYQQFVTYMNRKPADPIRDLIREDKFMKQIHESYSMSWALFYYLNKKEPRKLSEYIKKIGEREPYSQYTPEDRLADFEAVFGNDWEKFYRKFLNFYQSM